MFFFPKKVKLCLILKGRKESNSLWVQKFKELNISSVSLLLYVCLSMSVGESCAEWGWGGGVAHFIVWIIR